MTKLYKQNGGVFIPVNLTLEEVDDCLNEIQELKKDLLLAKQQIETLSDLLIS